VVKVLRYSKTAPGHSTIDPGPFTIDPRHYKIDPGHFIMMGKTIIVLPCTQLWSWNIIHQTSLGSWNLHTPLETLNMSPFFIHADNQKLVSRSYWSSDS